ncbi:MAG: hypothetical protein QF464_23785, partial [Myxococcota bacterium]|nr:hypothetical protein [Myxococcota bacterium]
MAHADVTFAHALSGGELVTGRLDDTLVFSTSDPSVIATEGNRVTGLLAGQASVIVLGASGEIGSAAVTVSDDAVAVTALDVVVPTEIVFDAFAPEPPFALAGSSMASASLLQVFDFEGKSGPIFAYATFDDGQRMDVTAEPGLSVTSLAPAALWVESDPLRAVSMDSGDGNLLDARWTVCESELAAGLGYVEMTLPAPTDAEITLSTNVLARAEDDAAALAGLPLCADVVVTLYYETGATKDFTLDARTSYDDISLDPSDLITVETVEDGAGSATGIQVCTTATSGFGPTELALTFTHAPELGVFKVPLMITQAETLSLVAHPWPAYAGSDAVEQST